MFLYSLIFHFFAQIRYGSGEPEDDSIIRQNAISCRTVDGLHVEEIFNMLINCQIFIQIVEFRYNIDKLFIRNENWISDPLRIKVDMKIVVSMSMGWRNIS